MLAMAIIAFHGASALPTHSTVLAAAGRVDLESGWHGAKALRSSTTHRRRDARRRPGRPPHKIACIEFERADSSTTRSPRPLTITRPGCAKLVIDLDSLDATLWLFVPDIDLDEIRHKPCRRATMRSEVRWPGRF